MDNKIISPFKILITWTLPPGYTPFKKEQSYKIIPFFNRVLFFADQKENAVHSMINLSSALKGKYVTGTRGKHSHEHIFYWNLSYCKALLPDSIRKLQAASYIQGLLSLLLINI